MTLKERAAALAKRKLSARFRRDLDHSRCGYDREPSDAALRPDGDFQYVAAVVGACRCAGLSRRQGLTGLQPIFLEQGYPIDT